MYKEYFKAFLEENKSKQLFELHSPFYGLDTAKNAEFEYWNEIAKEDGERKEHFYQHEIPKVKQYIARILGINHPEQIVFAPAIHDIIKHFISNFDRSANINILTTDSKSFDFTMQMLGSAGLDQMTVYQVPVDPIDTFEERFIEEAKSNKFNLIFFSQVFFNSAIPVRNPERIINAVNDTDAIIVMDGSHAFLSISFDLRSVQNKLFFMATIPAFTQEGKGACFLYRPKNKKWSEFMATDVDYSSLYAFMKVFELLEKVELSQDKIHAYIQKMQSSFLEEIAKYDHPLINENNLVKHDLKRHGHFLTFKLDNAEQVEKMAQLLKEHEIITDYSGDRLHFAFALYHDGNFDLSVLNTRRAYFFDELIF
ncbi:MAG: hypothetical protein ISR55_06860 [Bacteroidetes bacterium]|nr:hypothetical protein [Bacteroidota bacterium]